MYNMDDFVILGLVHDSKLQEQKDKYNKYRISTGLKVEFIPLWNVPLLHYHRDSLEEQGAK